MNTYIIKMLDQNNYNNLKTNEQYHLTNATVTAESEKKAFERCAMLYPDMYLNEFYIECVAQEVPSDTQAKEIRHYIEQRQEEINRCRKEIANQQNEIERIRHLIETAATM